MKLNSKTTAFVFPGQGSQVCWNGEGIGCAISKSQEQTFEEADSNSSFSFFETDVGWAGVGIE